MAGGLEGLLSGRTLATRYEIGEVIGRGGFAVVYRAADLRLHREVAVKVITLTAGDDAARETLRKRLHREAQAAAGLPHHPNLVTVHDVGTDPETGLDFLVMELLRGENVAQYLARDGRPPLEQGLRILRGAAEGLAVGHRAGLVHRDVKPANLFLAAPHGEESGPFRVCVLDYGIALAAQDDATMTRGEATPLSPAYASPEQLRGDRELGPPSDVFGLGVVGYELLTGERPFSAGPGQAPKGWTVRRPLREANPEVPAAVEAVLMRAMAPDPADRFPDADAFADALDTALAAPDDDATQFLPAAAAPVPAHRAPPPPPPRRRRAWPAVLVVAVLIAAAAAWAALAGGGDGPERTAGTPADTVVQVDGVVAEDELPPPSVETPPAPARAEVPVEPAPAEPSQPVETGEPQPATEPPPAGEQPPARQPQQPPARQPQQPPAEPSEPEPPAPEPPVQPVVVQPRPAPPDTVRIGPPR